MMAWFPEKNDPELERLAGIVFDLRRELFLRTRYQGAHEREWESDEREKRREEENERRVMEWDNDTRKIILGNPVFPSE